MRRFLAISLYSAFILMALTVLVGCGGGNKPANGGTTQIVLALSPNTTSLVQGGHVRVVATPEDSSGSVVTSVTPTFSVTSGGDLVSVSINGLVCAGQWDSLVIPVNCTPYDVTKVGNATITASVGSVTASVSLAVVPQIDNLTVTADAVSPLDPAGLACVSQSSTRNYHVSASLRGNPVDLPSSGVNWTLAISSIGTVAALQTGTDSSGKAITDSRTGVVTGLAPGRTSVIATVGTLQSAPMDFITCPVSQITLADSAASPTAMPITSPTTITLKPTVVDSKGTTLDLTKADASGNVAITLTWSSSRPTAASVSSGVITPSVNGGTTAIVASCTPPSCNYNLDGGGAVYSKPFMTTVTATSSPAAKTVYVGSKAPAPDANTKAPGLTLFPIPANTNTPGTAITLPAIPNSMLFSPSGNSLYIGTASGLVTVVAGTNAVSGPVAGAPGKVLAVSPDGATILVSDASVVSAGSPSHLYFVSSSGAIRSFNVEGATAAAFSPDNSRAFVVGGNQLTVYSPASFPVPQTLASGTGTDVAFLTSGSLAYVGAGSDVSVFPTCSTAFQVPEILPATILGSSPVLLGSLPDSSEVVAVDPPNVNLITVTTTNQGFTSASGCIPAVTNATSAPISVNGGSSFTPNQLIITPDGKRAFILSDQGQLLAVDLTNGQAAPVAVGGVAQTTGGVTVDGKQLYFGGKDNKVHDFDLTTNTEKTPISLSSAPSGFTTDFVAVQP